MRSPTVQSLVSKLLSSKCFTPQNITITIARPLPVGGSLGAFPGLTRLYRCRFWCYCDGASQKSPCLLPQRLRLCLWLRLLMGTIHCFYELSRGNCLHSLTTGFGSSIIASMSLEGGFVCMIWSLALAFAAAIPHQPITTVCKYLPYGGVQWLLWWNQ